MIPPRIKSSLSAKELQILESVKAQAERLLNHTPRFKFFTLHGTEHLNNLFNILVFMLDGGIKLSSDELFLISLAICVHDLGMVITLRDKDLADVLEGKPAFPDPATFENYIRDYHHELVDEYTAQHFGFLTDLGLTPTQIAQVIDISKCHRKVVLDKQVGVTKSLGALLRIIDELDVSASRAPTDVLLNNYDQMDAISCWHWFKHNITEGWLHDNTVFYQEQNGRKEIVFQIAVRPTKEQSISYWLNQVHRPIKNVLFDDGAQKIVKDKYGVEINARMSTSRSSTSSFSKVWQHIEELALSQNRKVILIVDDEFRKIEDTFFPLMDHYYVIPAYHAKDAIAKLEAANVDLAIVDMQLSSGGLWTDQETQDYKSTGINVCNHIVEHFSATKIGLLSGTKHALPPLGGLPLVFNLTKPIDPKLLLKKVKHVLS